MISGARWLWWTAVAVLLVVLGFELFIPAQEQAQTPDEANHMLAGARYWKYRDFGTNPEHPPLAKLVAALPILGVPCSAPTPYTQLFKGENFGSAIWFLYAHDADAMLLRSRMAISVFTFALALLVLGAGTEMFGRGTGLLAILLFVFEPNLLAHGSIVATDMAAACCYFAAVYAFYRWRTRPSTLRLLVCGLAAGLALAAKHSGILLAPVLLLLAFVELFSTSMQDESSRSHRNRLALRLAAGLAVIAVMSYLLLWAFYGFRYQARPGNLAMVPSLAAYAADTHSAWLGAVMPRLAEWHLLPEAYLFGLVDIVMASRRDPMFLLGTDYTTGHWFYFPVAFLIKSTLGFLVLLAIAPFLKSLKQRDKLRAMAFLLVPSVLYFSISLMSTMNIGVRHVLPVYPFFVLVAAAAAVALAKNRPWGIYGVAASVLCHVASSAHVFPHYLTYANEAWGGPSNTYRLLTDSNVDWGQGLKQAKHYLDQHGIKDCWFAHYGWDVNPAYYHIPCKPLPEGLSRRFSAPLPVVPASIEGTILVSGSEANGDYWGPGDLNPYAQFLQQRPDALIANSILVFHGKFGVPLLAALTHMSQAEQLANQHHFDEALTEARLAISLAPNSAEANAVLGNILLQMDRTDDARQAFQHAVALARSDHPDFQRRRILHVPPEYFAE